MSSTLDGTLYTHDIRRARLHDGRDILFNGRWAGKSGYGILVSYRTRYDRWTEPVNLLERLGVSRGGSQPIVTPDGKYLFYYAGGRFWWVDGAIVERLRPPASR